MFVLVLALGGMVPAGNGCAPVDDAMGLCSVSNSGSQVSVGGTVTVPQSRAERPPTSGVRDGGWDPGPGYDGPRSGDFVPAPPRPALRGAICGYLPACLPTPADPIAGGDPPAAPSIDYSAFTSSDLVSFTPASATATVEPSGLGIAGMPVNVVASAASHTLTGSLFGQPIVIRFDPAGYRFDYGDGTILEAATGGQSWDALGLPPFTATPTSHAYADPGEYTVSVVVHYVATLQAPDGRWFPVAGTVSSTASAFGVRVFEVSTALVEHTCAEDPAGPAC